MKATIVGSGLVGSLWALLLRREGLDVEVFEKRGDPRAADALAGRSINLIITSRGLHGLELAGLTARARKLAVPVYGRMMHARDGALAFQPYGREQECNLSISRAELNRFLIDEAEKAGALFHFHHDLSALQPVDKKITFRSPAGERVHGYDVLFGTDGAGSQVRRELSRFSPADFVDRTEWLEADYKEMSLPPNADGSPRLQGDALHIWPRGAHMLMGLANLDGGFTMTLYLPKEGGPWSFTNVHDRASVRRLFESEFPDAIPLMPNFEKEFLEHPQGSLGTVRLSHWVWKDSIALMGDACHAIVPFFGQGMNSGFEDATVLLEEWRRSKDWGSAMAAYEHRQKPNADAIASMALENWVEMKDRVGDPRFLLRKKVEGALESRFPQLYKSRYGLIMYTLVPYATAQRAGEVQDRLLAKLMTDCQTLDDVSWKRAEELLTTEWRPFVESQKMDLRRYDPPG